MLARLLSLAEVTRTAVRIAVHYDREPLDLLVHRLLTGSPWTRDLETLTTTAERWLWLLPPRGMRPCLKRSLLLASLKRRCGESARIHIGFRSSDRGLEGHAWIACDAHPPAPEGFTEMVALP